jgi:hypothetical protein
VHLVNLDNLVVVEGAVEVVVVVGEVGEGVQDELVVILVLRVTLVLLVGARLILGDLVILEDPEEEEVVVVEEAVVV